MNKYGKLLRYELKGILRDPMTMMMLGFPVLLLVLSCFVFPRVLQGLPPMEALTARTVSLLMVLFVLSGWSKLTDFAGTSAYMAAEHLPLAHIAGHFGGEPVAIADAFRRNQRALGIEPGQDIAKPLPLGADQVLRRDLEVVEEEGRSRGRVRGGRPGRG